jgi:hypothetical protein
MALSLFSLFQRLGSFAGGCVLSTGQFINIVIG